MRLISHPTPAEYHREVRAFRAEGVTPKISARVPPTMLAYNNTRVKLILQSGAHYPHSPRLD